MNEIVSFVAANPVLVLTDKKSYSEFYKRIKDEVDAFKPDLSTATSRKEISKLAYKVTRTKTAIDDAGKKLNEDARAKINAVDASRRKIREELEALADEVRKPLTLWEEAEDNRMAKIASDLQRLSQMAVFGSDVTSAILENQLGIARGIEFDPAIWRDAMPDAIAAKDKAISDMEALLERVLKQEADAAELARLRCENDERITKEREAAEQARLAEIAEERRQTEVARAAKEAEDAKRQEEERAEHQRQAIATAEARAREEEKRRADEAIAKAEAEKQALVEKQESEDRQRLAVIEAEQKAQALRDADRKHRGNIMALAKTAIMTLGVEEIIAKKIVTAIVGNEIPNVSLRF